jgi:hypothetical protein
VVIGRDGTDDHTLAHELTHVLQQRSGPVAGTDDGTGLRISDPADRFERDAETNATRAMSGAAPSVHDTMVARSLGAQQIQRVSAYSEGGVNYHLSENGLFAIVDGQRQVWARQGTQVSSALVANPAGNRMINGQVYEEYQISRWILKDCLHTAEEIINGLPGQLHSARDLDLLDAGSSEGRYSRIKANTGRWRQFGGSDDQNIANAQAFGGAKNMAADPGIGQAFVILATAARTAAMSPYHAAAVVGVDGNDRITLEEWDARGQVSRGAAHMYTVGDPGWSFHAQWGSGDAYFANAAPLTVVISAVSRPPAGQSARTRDLNVFGPNTFGDEPDRATTGWRDSP